MNFLNPKTKALEDIYYQEVNNHLTKEDKLPKRLKGCIMKNDD